MPVSGSVVTTRRTLNKYESGALGLGIGVFILFLHETVGFVVHVDRFCSQPEMFARLCGDVAPRNWLCDEYFHPILYPASPIRRWRTDSHQAKVSSRVLKGGGPSVATVCRCENPSKAFLLIL